MRTLSIQQPWAWLIVNGNSYSHPKDVENRTWPTKRRGKHFVHAGKKFDQLGYDSVIARRPELQAIMPTPKEFERGGIVGVVDILECVAECGSEWFTGRYAFVLANPLPLPFIACRGALGFFEAGPDVPTSIFKLLEE